MKRKESQKVRQHDLSSASNTELKRLDIVAKGYTQFDIIYAYLPSLYLSAPAPQYYD